MNKNSNTYTFIYAAILIVVVAAVLAFVADKLKPRQVSNVETEKRMYILRAARLGQEALTASNRNAYVAQEFAKYITESFVVDAQGQRVEGEAFSVDMKAQTELLASGNLAKLRLPVYKASLEDGRSLYVLSVYGAGLWGPVWGYIAVEADFNTVYGTVFDHKGETPGLGAEIANPKFSGQFTGKTLFENGAFVSVQVKKGGGTQGQTHAVDAISGGTITSRAVENMLSQCLGAYVPFIQKQLNNR